MRWRITNWMLAPIFAITVACSLANIGQEAPKSAKKMSAPCPLHPQQQEAPDSSSERPRCLNCLTGSVLGEQKVAVSHIVALTTMLPVLAVSVPSVPLLAVHPDRYVSFAAESPDSRGAPPLRV